MTEAYDYAYRLTMQRIEEQPPDRAKLGREVLAWITCLHEPFKSADLRKALGIQVGQSTFDEDDCPDVLDMISACAGLVTIDEESNIIRLVHYTTQEYLDRTRHRWFPEAETVITEACIAYLSMEEYGTAGLYSDLTEKLEYCNYLQKFPAHWDPLYCYAACNWGRHARMLAGVNRMAIDFFGLSWNLKCSALVILSSLADRPDDYNDISFRRPRSSQDSTSGIHLAAHFGLCDTLVALLRRGYDVNAPDRLGLTPLMLAAESGHLETVRLLLRHGAKTDSKSGYRYSTLHFAVHSGNIGIVQLVIADTATQNIMDAMLYGQPQIESRVWTRYSPLYIAVDRGYVDIIRLLIDHGVDVNLKGGYAHNRYRHKIPLAMAVDKQDREIIDVLLDAGADINCANNWGRTVLHSSAFDENISLLEHLLDKGADVNFQDLEGRTPLLTICSMFTHDASISVMLNAGADPNICDKEGQPLLHGACVGE